MTLSLRWDGMRAVLLAAVGMLASSFGQPADALAENAYPPAKIIACDLLIVGGTESACAAAVQAARMGVQKIVLVNDIQWLGGQFSAEALVAIDENRGPAGYSASETPTPFPRSGSFKEITQRIEALNREKYGRERPGNTRVATTTRPHEAARLFQEWIDPYVQRGQIQVVSHYRPYWVDFDGNRLAVVKFESTQADEPILRVEAQLTIDASDWGEVIHLSGGPYEFGPDLKAKYAEPLAPTSRKDYPLTDMNPITYCMVVEETDTYEPIAAPPGYDPLNYRSHKWPKDPLWLYGTRRLVDHYHFKDINQPDCLLLCFPAFDYPLDVLPQSVAAALEATEPGASKKNIVQLTPAQRQIIFEDAKQYSLGFLHYLQTEVHESMADTTHSFRRFRLSREFGTADHLPFKPYIRESLRLKAMYMMRQQDTTGSGNNANNFAQVMYHDGIAAWQFEYDFHPTRREFLNNGDPDGPWRCGFREGRTWGPPYSGRALFPLRSLVPETIDGLLGAQKNLGYSSIVSSAVRLHDQSMAIGQAAGAVAAVAIGRNVQPRRIPYDPNLLDEVRRNLCTSRDGGIPQALWPFRDLEPTDPCYAAANLLASRGGLPLSGTSIDFLPNDPATAAWRAEVVKRSTAMIDSPAPLHPPAGDMSRRQFVEAWWRVIKDVPLRPYDIQSPHDADADGIADLDDPLLFTKASTSMPHTFTPEEEAAYSGQVSPLLLPGRRFNFTGVGSAAVEGFTNDTGQPFDAERGYGWTGDLRENHRRRGQHANPVYDTFLFTRATDVWECIVDNGRYEVTLCVGDSGHEQLGQTVAVEGKKIVDHQTTAAGRFLSPSVVVEVRDGRLTVELGTGGPGENTCLNWLVIQLAE